MFDVVSLGHLEATRHHVVGRKIPPMVTETNTLSSGPGPRHPRKGSKHTEGEGMQVVSQYALAKLNNIALLSI